MEDFSLFTVADSYVTAASQSAGFVAKVVDRKNLDYSDLSATYECQHVDLRVAWANG